MARHAILALQSLLASRGRMFAVTQRAQIRSYRDHISHLCSLVRDKAK